MFARTVNGVVLATAAAIALAVGSACKCPDSVAGLGCGGYYSGLFSVVARGVNVVPAAADTSGRASVNFNIATLAYAYFVTVTPSGTIDSIALYQVDAGEPLPASATAILCAGAAACASTSGTATVVPPATRVAIQTSLLAYGTQLVFFTTTAQKAAGGAMRGTMFLNP
jgi:hypothetical protein